MIFELIYFLLKVNAIFLYENEVFDVKKHDSIVDVAKLVLKKRFVFLLIEIKNDRDFVIKQKVNFYFRTYDEVMLSLFV